MTYPSANHLLPLFLLAIPMSLGCQEDQKPGPDHAIETSGEASHDDDDDWIKIDGSVTNPDAQENALDYAGIDAGDTGSIDGTGMELAECEANISGFADRRRLDIQSVAWAIVDDLVVLVGNPDPINPCLAFEDSSVDLADVGMLMGGAYGLTEGFEGSIGLISAEETEGLDDIEEDVFAGFTWTPPAPEGQSTEYSLKHAVHFSEGLLTVDAPLRIGDDLVGSFDVSDGASSSLTGSFNACWCEGLAELLEE